MSVPSIEFGSPAADTSSSAIPSARIKVPHPPRPERIPVSVGGVVISYEAISAEAQQHPASSPAEAFRLATKALVIRELLLQEARAAGTTILQERDAKGRLETEEDALIRSLLEQKVTTPVADELACRRYYDRNPNRFSTGAIYEVRHILLPVSLDDEGDERAKAKKTAQTLIEELTLNPGRFSDLARGFSACPSREVGGSLGQVTAGCTVPEFESMLAQLSEGQLCSVPVPTRFGYHVVFLDRVIQGSQLAFEAVHERIAVYLEAASWSRAVSQFIGVLAADAEILGVEFDLPNGAASGVRRG